MLLLIEMFKGKVVDVGQRFVMVEVSGPESKIEAFIDICKPYGIKSVARTGTIAMPRQPKADTPSGRRSDKRSERYKSNVSVKFLLFEYCRDDGHVEIVIDAVFDGFFEEALEDTAESDIFLYGKKSYFADPPAFGQIFVKVVQFLVKRKWAFCSYREHSE